MAFSEELIQRVWEKGRTLADRNADEWRQDECGAWLAREAYAEEHSDYGWKIVNTSLGGADTLDNLRPLHCNNGFDYPSGKAHCHVTADREGVQPTAHVGQPVNKSV
jgi:hypothetical protein